MNLCEIRWKQVNILKNVIIFRNNILIFMFNIYTKY